MTTTQDLLPAITELLAVADLQRLGKLVTTDTSAQYLSSLVGDFKSTTAPQQVSLSSGVARVERLAKLNIIALDTDGGAVQSDFHTVEWMGTGSAIVGDIYVFCLKTQVHRVNCTNAGTIKVGRGGFMMDLPDSLIGFIVSNDSNLVEIFRYPLVDIADAAISSSVGYVDTGTDTLTVITRIVSAIALSAETLSEGSITIDSATGGRVEAWVDEGFGGGMIGFYDWQSRDSEQDVADGLVASINLGTRYTAAILGGVPMVGVTAPIGTGSAANSYTLYSVVTTGITTTDTSFGGVTVGTDGTEINADIATIDGGSDGPIYIHNAMSSATLTLVSGGNLTGTTPMPIAAGSYRMLLKIGSNYALPE